MGQCPKGGAHHYVKTDEIARPDARDLKVMTCTKCGDSYTQSK